MDAYDEMKSYATQQKFKIRSVNLNPVCVGLPTLCVYVGTYFLYDLTSFCSDPDGHDITITASAIMTGGVTFDLTTNELFGTPTAVYGGGLPEIISFQLTDNYMLGTSGPFTMQINSRDLIVQVPPAPVCTAAGPNSYTITNIDTQTIFLNTLTTSTVSKAYMSTTLPDTLSTSASAVNPHQVYSGTLVPGEH